MTHNDKEMLRSIILRSNEYIEILKKIQDSYCTEPCKTCRMNIDVAKCAFDKPIAKLRKISKGITDVLKRDAK